MAGVVQNVGGKGQASRGGTSGSPLWTRLDLRNVVQLVQEVSK